MSEESAPQEHGADSQSAGRRTNPPLALYAAVYEEKKVKRDVAREISTLMLETTEKLDRSVVRMRAQLPPAEFGTYGRAVGTILAEIIMEVLDPLYAEHPDLKPPEMS